MEFIILIALIAFVIMIKIGTSNKATDRDIAELLVLAKNEEKTRRGYIWSDKDNEYLSPKDYKEYYPPELFPELYTVEGNIIPDAKIDPNNFNAEYY